MIQKNAYILFLLFSNIFKFAGIGIVEWIVTLCSQSDNKVGLESTLVHVNGTNSIFLRVKFPRGKFIK